MCRQRGSSLTSSSSVLCRLRSTTLQTNSRSHHQPAMQTAPPHARVATSLTVSLSVFCACYRQLLSALSSAHTSLSAFTVQYKLSVEEVESVQDGWRNVLQQQDEVNEALSHDLPSEVVDEDVEAEYQRMLQNEAAEQTTEASTQQPRVAAHQSGFADSLKRAAVAAVITLS